MSKHDSSADVTVSMKGEGYYDAHSEYQRRVIEAGAETIRDAVGSLDLAAIPGAITIADYGAGTGKTSVFAMGSAIAALDRREAGRTVFAVHNDLFANDFTQLFRNIAADEGYLKRGQVYAAAVGGSFFEQVVPAQSVHFGMCSNAAHWFRKQPKVSMPEGMYFPQAGEGTRRSLAEQAAEDWLAFLCARGKELVPGGCFVVQGIATLYDPDGTEHVAAALPMRVMGEIAAELAAEGLLDRGVLDRYLFPVYCRSRDEAIAPMKTGGALAEVFKVVSATVDEVADPYWELYQRDGDAAAYAKIYTEFIRAFSETSLARDLFAAGAKNMAPAALCTEFFARFEAAVARDPAAARYRAWILRLVLARRGR
ncbi:MAG: hypothetical protein ACRER1_08240 [Gammaproteobacteria bacterium]